MVVLKLWRPVCGTSSNVHVAGPVTSGCPVREIVSVPFHVPVKKDVSPGEVGVEPPPQLASTTDANPISESARTTVLRSGGHVLPPGNPVSIQMLHLETVRFRIVSAHRQQLGDAALSAFSRDVNDQINRQRDRLSNACMWQPGGS